MVLSTATRRLMHDERVVWQEEINFDPLTSTMLRAYLYQEQPLRLPNLRATALLRQGYGGQTRVAPTRNKIHWSSV